MNYMKPPNKYKIHMHLIQENWVTIFETQLCPIKISTNWYTGQYHWCFLDFRASFCFSTIFNIRGLAPPLLKILVTNILLSFLTVLCVKLGLLVCLVDVLLDCWVHDVCYSLTFKNVFNLSVHSTNFYIAKFIFIRITASSISH